MKLTYWVFVEDTYICVCTYICTYVYVCIYIHVHKCMYVNQIDRRREFFKDGAAVLGCVEDIDICTHIYVCIYVHIYICM